VTELSVNALDHKPFVEAQNDGMQLIQSRIDEGGE
jgi:hypothetical protein